MDVVDLPVLNDTTPALEALDVLTRWDRSALVTQIGKQAFIVTALEIAQYMSKEVEDGARLPTLRDIVKRPVLAAVSSKVPDHEVRHDKETVAAITKALKAAGATFGLLGLEGDRARIVTPTERSRDYMRKVTTICRCDKVDWHIYPPSEVAYAPGSSKPTCWRDGEPVTCKP